MSSSCVPIIGIGDDGLLGLTEAARRIVLEADVLYGPRRTLDSIGDEAAGKRIAFAADLNELCEQIANERVDRRLVVLTPGDPLFYGVARYLCDRLGKDSFRVVPHVSSMQLAFARVAESWEDAYLSNVASHALEDIVERIRGADRVGLFTDEATPPNRVAKALLSEGIDSFRAYVCENLGARNEVVTQGSLQEIAESSFGSLNVMILIRNPKSPGVPPRHADRGRFGNPDELFLQSRPKRGLLTPAEVRTLALAKLDVRPESVVWDIGAGSGAVAIEAAQLATAGAVYAIEPEFEDCDLIRQNAETFSVRNVHVIMGRAPEAFVPLPAPNSVFVGGTGRETIGILDAAFDRLLPGGNLVANVATLENVSAATGVFKARQLPVGLLMVNVARGVSQLETVRFEAVNPSFLIYVRKPNRPTDDET